MIVFHRMITLLGHIPWLARFIVLVPTTVKDLNNMRQVCIDRAIARKEKGTEQKDLFYYLVLSSTSFPPSGLATDGLPSQSDELGAEKEGIPFEIVANDADLITVAGSDTSKTVLSSLFYYLLCNREKLDKLREEVDRFYPPGESLSSKHFQEMSYLDACINETLRLAPPVPSGSQRDAGPNPDPSKGRTFGPQCVLHHCQAFDADS